MECTQRLECTQQEFLNQTQRECPEQIGFLGICGNKYPVKKGPNKVGRDPQTCSIVLNLNSISRQHAVINVLNSTEFMLMDLDSANKTRLLGKPLQPYMPQPLKNGDMVQFGDVFGIFRLLEEVDELPMTQALPMTQPIHIPDTPIPTRHISKLNLATTVPESPDVSDKDDSFVIASQPKGHQFKNTNAHNFIKPGRTISIQPIGGNKIDNVFWNSSKKSTSFDLDDSNTSLNDSTPFDKENEVNANNIHEMETQPFRPTADPIHELDTQVFPNRVKTTDPIYDAHTQPIGSPIPDCIDTANTQIPGLSTFSPSIFTANTQLPGSITASPNIHTANTQVPDVFHSPSIHSLETQVPPGDNLPDVCKINEQQDMQFDICADNDIYLAETQIKTPTSGKSKIGLPSSNKSDEISKLNKSDDIVFFDEIDSQPDDENFESQAILIDDIVLPVNKCVETESEPLSQIIIPKSSKRNMRIESDSSTDCEEIDNDILPTQKIPVKERTAIDGDATDCEDEMIELKVNKKPNNTAEALDLEDVATQVIEVLETPPAENKDFEDMLTQKIDVVEVLNDTKELPEKIPAKAQLIADEVEISPFKIPLKSVFKAKKKDASKIFKVKAFVNVENTFDAQKDSDKYYQDTQDIYEDLCSQKEPFYESKMSPSTKSDSDVEEKINNFVSTLSSQDVRDVIGAEKVASLERVSSIESDTSDLEVTPKKNRPFKLMDIDLPSSQEIKHVVSLTSKTIVTESSSDSETEQSSEDQCTPILFRKKKKPKHDAKLDLTKKFDVEALPTRVITRVRKPTSKMQDVEGKNTTESILKPKFLTEQDDDVDRDIITENITRLKNKNEKSKIAKDSKVTKLDETRNIDATKSLSETTKLVPTPFVDNIKTDEKKENKSQTKVVKEKIVNPELISEDIKEETVNKKESKRKKKSSSPVEDSKDIVDHTSLEDSEKTNETNKMVEKVNTFKDIDDQIKTRESERTKTSASIVKVEKPRGPIMIEAHTITAPAKEEKPKKREYKRKNKEPATTKSANKLENHNFTLEPKAEDTKVERLDLTESKRPVRSTRGKKKNPEDFIDPTEVNSQIKEKPKRGTKAKEASPEKEVRRSKRQRTVKNEPVKAKEKEPVKSILKKTSMHEQSTVYNLSSGSTDSPANLKRSANEFEAPMPKRTRSAANNTNLRATPSRTQKTCYVLFTAFPYEEVRTKLEKLGAVVVTDVMQCTVLLTLQIKRTFKLLCAVGLGKPIVGPNWVQACADTNMIVDPWLYLIKDETAEKRFHFSLPRTLGGRRQFLQGYHVSSTPSTMPQASEMKLIVQCSGGTWQEGGARWLCLSCAADKALWPELRRRGAILVTTELILGGVLQQRLDIEANRIKVQ